jgi:outer membrane protein assembly factor BamB
MGLLKNVHDQTHEGSGQLSTNFLHMRIAIDRGLALLLVLLLVGGCSGLKLGRVVKTGPEDWNTFGGSSLRMNQSTASLHPPLREILQYNAQSGVLATPLVRDSVLLVGTLQGELHAVNLRNGARLGYLVLDGSVIGTPVWSNGNVCIPLASGTETLVSYSLFGGTKNWSAKLGPIESSPALFERRLYVTTVGGFLYCVNVQDGTEVWKFQTDVDEKRKPIRSSPATNGEIVVFGCDDGGIYAVECATGNQRWKIQTKRSIFASPVIVQDRVFVGSLDGAMYCLDARSGTILWKCDTESPIYGAASSDGKKIFVGTADGICFALEIDGGSVAWKFKARSVINCAPLVTKDLVFVCSLDKNLYALNAVTGKETWRFTAEGRIKVSPVLWGGLLIVASEDKYVTVLREETP